MPLIYLTAPQCEVIDEARVKMKGESWYLTPCLNDLPTDAEILVDRDRCIKRIIDETKRVSLDDTARLTDRFFHLPPFIPISQPDRDVRVLARMDLTAATLHSPSAIDDHIHKCVGRAFASRAGYLVLISQGRNQQCFYNFPWMMTVAHHLLGDFSSGGQDPIYLLHTFGPDGFNRFLRVPAPLKGWTGDLDWKALIYVPPEHFVPESAVNEALGLSSISDLDLIRMHFE